MSYRPLKTHRAEASRHNFGELPGGTVVYWDSPRPREFYEDVFCQAHRIPEALDRHFVLSAGDLGMEFESAVEPALSLGAMLVLPPHMAEPDGRRFVYLPEEGQPVALTVQRCSSEPLGKILAAVGQAVARERRGR